MKTNSDPLRRALAERLRTVEPSLDLAEIYDQLVAPPDPKFGDLAFGCFKLAKVMREPPPAIATRLATALSTSLSSDDVVGAVSATGPYVNFTISFSALGRELLDPARDGGLFHQRLTENEPRTMIEFSQPNTHKELHVGHMRNLCLGDALVCLQRYVGVDVVASTFPGDMGTHVAKCLWYLKHHNTEPTPVEEKGAWLGRMYSLGHLKLEDEQGTPQEVTNRAELTEILKQLERHEGEYYDLWRETRQWSIDLMKEVYDWAGVGFDVWYWESEVDAASVTLVHQYLDQGKLVRSDGAVGMDLNEYKLGFCLLLKSDGTGLYATKDLELARRKFEEFKIDRNIYVVDMRQALHFQQVFKTLELLGFSQAKDCHHLQYNFVELPDGAMSSRKGNIVPIMDLIRQMEAQVKKDYLNRHLGEWTQKEVDDVAQMVAQGAIKYGMLRMDTNKKIVFDMNEWLKIDGESGPFIQYSYARIASLQRKLDYSPEAPVDWETLKEVPERRLAQQLLHFHSIVLGAALDFRPSLLCTYLYELAKRFNVFYHECSIGGAATPELRTARLALSAATGAVLKGGLGLLGIPAPERM